MDGGFDLSSHSWKIQSITSKVEAPARLKHAGGETSFFGG